MSLTNVWVYRRRTTPLYRHHELDESCQTTGTKRKHSAYIDIDGSISDGDDHVWLGNLMILEGGGGWKSILSAENMETALGKQSEDKHRDKNAKTGHCGPNSPTELDPALLSREEDEVMDLLAVTAPSSPSSGSNISLQRSSSPVMYGSDDEAEVRIIFQKFSYSFYWNIDVRRSLIDTMNFCEHAQKFCVMQQTFSTRRRQFPIHPIIASGRSPCAIVILVKMWHLW